MGPRLLSLYEDNNLFVILYNIIFIEPYLTWIKLVVMGFIFGLAANLAKYISKTMASSDIADPYSPVIEIVSIGFSF